MTELEQRVAVLERTVALLVAALKQPSPTDQGEDGAPRRWLLLREAAEQTGYSSKWLRELIRRGVVQGRYRGPHLTVAVDTVPRKVGGLPGLPKVPAPLALCSACGMRNPEMEILDGRRL
jgi:hypothetical protein